MDTHNALEVLRGRAREFFVLHELTNLLEWDRDTQMPQQARVNRAKQLEFVNNSIRAMFAGPEWEKLFSEFEAASSSFSPADVALARVMKRHWMRQSKLSHTFVASFYEAQGKSLSAWKEARETSNFAIFEPHLQRMIELAREKAELFGYRDSPYDALLDEFEEGLSLHAVKQVFSSLVPDVSKLIQNALSSGSGSQSLVRISGQGSEKMDFIRQVLVAMGFDFERGRVDFSHYSYCTSLGGDDCRMLLRAETPSLEFITAALHEGGHSLFEQGIPSAFHGTPLARPQSLVLHESQSRLWENVIGRSHAFWAHMYPALQAAFPQELSDVSLNDFCSSLNAVRPGPLRIGCDELTYDMHIQVRFEIETLLISGEAKASDVPALWRDLYKKYLGVVVKSDAEGCLQDIHWAMGYFGYFPAYTLGNVVAVQLWQTYKKHNRHVEETLQKGDFHSVREWLYEHFYSFGSMYPYEEVLRRATQEPLNPSYYLDYLALKFGK